MTEQPTTAAGRALLDRLSNLPNEGYPETFINIGVTILAIEAEARQQDDSALRIDVEAVATWLHENAATRRRITCGPDSLGCRQSHRLDAQEIAALPPSAPPALDVKRLVAAAMLDQPAGGGWNDQIVMSKADLHDLLNRHTEAQIRAALARLEPER